MASERIGYDDIFDPKAIETAINEVKKLQKQLSETSDELKEMVKLSSELAKESGKSFNNADKIRETEKAINDTVKATSQLDALEKKRIKLEQTLLELEDKRAQSNAMLAEQIRQKRKALRDEAKEANANRNAFQKLTKQTNEAQAEFKRLAAEFGASSKQAKEAYKEFIRLDDQLREINDAAKDGRRDVGRYRIAVSKLGDSLGKLGAVTGVVAVLSKVFEGFQAVLGNNSEASATLEKAMGRITVTFTVLLGRITKALPFLANLFKSVFADVANSVEGAFLKMQVSFLEMTSVFGSNTEKIAKLNEELQALNKETSNTSQSWEELANIFEGTGEEISNTIDANDRLIDTTLQYRREILTLGKARDELLSQQAALQNAADNENKSLKERIQFQKQLIDQTDEINRLDLEIAERNKELAEENAAIFKDSLDAKEAARDAAAEFVALEIAQEAERLAAVAELQTLEADLLEQRLDFLIDNFDNQKTINERLLADETLTYEERNRLLDENKRLAEESFQAQLQAFNERLEEQGKAQLDFEALVKESDSRLIAEQALNAGLSERLTNRLLEVIRERRTVTQDNVEAEQDLTEATKESQKLAEETALNLQYVNELKAEGVDVEKVLQKLEDERLQMTIENLRTQIALLDEGSEKRIELEKQLSDALLEEQQRRLDAEAEAEEKALERRQEIQEAAASTLEKFAEKRHEKRMNRIEEELEAEQKRADELRELARQGIQDAENNLAENQKRIAEIERQREKELKRQKQFELALAAARAYSANVAAGEKNPLAKTITDVTLLEAFVESLTGFYHGTEDTGNKGVIADEYGVITGYTHANERVLTASQNAMIPDSVSNWDLARMAQNFGQPEQPSTSENILISGLKEVKNAIEKKPSYIGREYDATERAVIDSYQEKGRLLRRHYKRSGLISKRR